MTRMTLLRSPFAVSVVLAALLAAGCGDVGVSELAGIPQPQLAGADESVRRELAQARRRAEEQVRDHADDPVRQALAIGRLCLTYDRYQLDQAAEACFKLAVERDREQWSYFLALLYHRTGRLADARALLERLVESNPDDAMMRYRLGEVALDANRPAEAVEHLRVAAETLPRQAAIRYALGRALLAADQAADALPELRAALKLSPTAGRIHHSLGLAYRQLGEATLATQHLEQQGQQAPGLHDSRLQKVLPGGVEAGVNELLADSGRAASAGRLDEAEVGYRRVLDIEPKRNDARLALASVLARQGELDKSERLYRQALETEPENPTAAHQLGRIFSVKGDDERALELFQQTLQAAPDSVDARRDEAWTLHRLGRRQESLRRFRELLDVRPLDGEIRCQYATVLAAGGDLEEAMRQVERAVSDDPRNVTVRLLAAQVQATFGRRVRAAGHWEWVLEDASSHATEKSTAALNLATKSLEDGDPTTALDFYARAVDFQPDNAQALLAWGRLLASQNELTVAAEKFASAAIASGDGMEAALLEARVRLELKQYEKARSLLERGLERFSGHPVFAYELSKLLASAPDPALRDGATALELARRIEGSVDPLLHKEAEAMALAEVGDFPAAVRTLEAALASAVGAGEVQPRIRQQLARYRQNQPVRLPG